MSKIRILVLGDLGCSPRMSNHCLSFVKFGWKVYFSGYLQSELHQSITTNDQITIEPIKESPPFINQRKENKFFLILKVLFTSFNLFLFLLTCQWTNLLLIQNPPAVPTFFVAWIIAKFRGIKLLVDWHNYGFSLMGSGNKGGGGSGILTRLYKNLEIDFAQKTLKAKHFCVSKAFANDLLLKWKIQADVLYDKPWNVNGDRNMKSIHELLIKLGEQYPVLKHLQFNSNCHTALTEKFPDGRIEYRFDRPALIVSSCSWTIDDDFETLFKALDQYNCAIVNGKSVPNIICVITGKGPMKQYFQRIVSEQEWSHVFVIMPWLEIEDYPTILSAADIGICLHNSTSGLDLPMKIVDMFSVGLPVLALNYKCLHELVIDRQNGRLFSSHDGLYNHLCDLLPSIKLIDQSSTDIAKYRNNIISNTRSDLWLQHWEEVVLPVARDSL